jgi:hypothetical protein
VRPFVVSEVDARWEELPATPGVYIVRRSTPVARIGGVDRTGVLYVGRGLNLRVRLWQFYTVNHTASGFLWEQPALAGPVLGKAARGVAAIERAIDRLTVRYSAGIAKSKLARAERALMFAYLIRYGEAPPLNLALSGRWDYVPNSSDLRWAETGLFSRG